MHDDFGDVGVSPHLILDTTKRLGISKFYATQLYLPFSAVVSYRIKNLFQFRLPTTMPLPHLQVSQHDLHAAYGLDRVTSANGNQPNILLPQDYGVYAFSRVGFDRSGKHAVVYAQLTYCALCGTGAYLYLSKESGTWHVIRSAPTWAQ